VKTFLLTLLLSVAFAHCTHAQEFFTIKRYDVSIQVNKDASLDIEESIYVNFTSERHGIYRSIPYRYQLQSLPEGTEKADRQLVSGGSTSIIIENLRVVNGWDYKVSTQGSYKEIRIGSADKFVTGAQEYVIRYRVLNAINFFKDFSELYFNIIGDKWSTTIDSVNFSVTLHEALPGIPDHFVATGYFGSRENSTKTQWNNNAIFSGATTRQLQPHEGVTIGIRFPKGYLIKQNYALKGIYWMLLPVVVLVLTYLLWKRLGKDDPVTIRTEYYPPPGISPSVSGYIIDDRLNQRDLTALVPYWGAGGYLRIEEIEETALFGLIKDKEYKFIKLKDLPPSAMNFERTMFNGIFESGDQVMLKDLKNVLYKKMNNAKKELEAEVDRSQYYTKNSRGLGIFMIVISIAIIFLGLSIVQDAFERPLWPSTALFASALIIFIFGLFMAKKTKKGTLLYQQLAGFREFVRSVEQDRLREFLKQDEHYFDKILPYAIVFNAADNWKDKLDGLDIPPPGWYHGRYPNNSFSTYTFMNSLNRSMNEMSSTFYSSPKSSGSSGGSFGGGGSSGGGFGGGGGGSW
jgi:uncharacterized membrane protein